jgi:hypothetical protein
MKTSPAASRCEINQKHRNAQRRQLPGKGNPIAELIAPRDVDAHACGLITQGLGGFPDCICDALVIPSAALTRSSRQALTNVFSHEFSLMGLGLDEHEAALATAKGRADNQVPVGRSCMWRWFSEPALLEQSAQFSRDQMRAGLGEVSLLRLMDADRLPAPGNRMDVMGLDQFCHGVSEVGLANPIENVLPTARVTLCHAVVLSLPLRVVHAVVMTFPIRLDQVHSSRSRGGNRLRRGMMARGRSILLHHPAVERRLAAIGTPQFLAKPDQVQPGVPPDQPDERAARKGAGAATGTGQPQRLVPRQVIHGEGEGWVHAGRPSRRG